MFVSFVKLINEQFIILTKSSSLDYKSLFLFIVIASVFQRMWKISVKCKY